MQSVCLDHVDLRDLDALSADELSEFLNGLITMPVGNAVTAENILSCFTYAIPKFDTNRRFAYVAKMLAISEKLESNSGRAAFHFLATGLLRSLSTTERVTLAGMMRDNMVSHQSITHEAAMWGLIRIIPHLHNLNKKEFAHDIFMMSRDPQMRHHVLEGLTALIFSLDRDDRTGMVMFFAEGLKRECPYLLKYFTIELLKKIVSALPEAERLLIADAVAPLVFHTDQDLVRNSLDFFVTVMGFIDETQRYHYAQMLATLLGDVGLQDDAVVALERILPYLGDEIERQVIRAQLEPFAGFDDPGLGDALLFLEPLFGEAKH